MHNRTERFDRGGRDVKKREAEGRRRRRIGVNSSLNVSSSLCGVSIGGIPFTYSTVPSY